MLNRKAKQTFYLLLFSLILLFVTSYCVFNSLNRFFKAPQDINSHIIHIIQTIKKKPQSIKVLKTFNNRFFKVWMTKNPIKHTMILKDKLRSNLFKQLHKPLKHQTLSLQLKNKNWLNIYVRIPRKPLIFFLSIISIIVLFLILLTILCYWAVKRLSYSNDRLIQNIKNLGQDIQAISHTNLENPLALEAYIHDIQLRINKMINEKNYMLAAISHDLRTPITRIKLRLEYLENHEQYPKILLDLEEIENMITAILKFAKEDLYQELPSWFDLNALLDTLISDLQDLNLSVIYQSNVEKLPFYGRMDALKRAFSNIINNALKYGKKTVVQLIDQEENIQIHIHDNGPGISKEELEKVFEPFYRTRKTHHKSGSGLGLVIAQNNIQAHGGTLKLKNRPEGGLCVIITIKKSQ